MMIVKVIVRLTEIVMMRMIGRDSYDDIDTKMNYFLNFNNRDLLDLIFFCNCIIPYSKPSAVGGQPNDYHNDDDIDGNYNIEEGRS